MGKKGKPKRIASEPNQCGSAGKPAILAKDSPADIGGGDKELVQLERFPLNMEYSESEKSMSKTFFQPALLMTESKQDYEALQARLEQEIGPRSFVESMYVADILALVWDIQRLRRCKTGIITNAFNEALQTLLRLHFGFDFTQARDLAQRWLVEPAAKSEVAKLLRSAHLDEFAIEAEAVRASASDLEALDRMLSAYESRRNKALRGIEDYRVGFAKTVRESSDRALQQDRVPKIGHRANKTAA
jgi:hypothetical protein